MTTTISITDPDRGIDLTVDVEYHVVIGREPLVVIDQVDLMDGTVWFDKSGIEMFCDDIDNWRAAGKEIGRRYASRIIDVCLAEWKAERELVW